MLELCYNNLSGMDACRLQRDFKAVDDAIFTELS